MSEVNRGSGLVQQGWFLKAMFLLFLGLKLSGKLDWSWWIVVLPIAADFFTPEILAVLARCGKRWW